MVRYVFKNGSHPPFLAESARAAAPSRATLAIASTQRSRGWRKGGGQLAKRLRAVRWQEAQQAALLALEQALRFLHEIEKRRALVHSGPPGGLVAIDLALQARLLPAPLAGKAVMDTIADGVCHSFRAIGARGLVPALALPSGGIAIALRGVVAAAAIAAAKATR